MSESIKISNILKKKFTLSFEVFPPKDDAPLDNLNETLEYLRKVEPDFISVTYGAGGSDIGRTIEVASLVMLKRLEVLQHFTCIGNKKSEIIDFTNKYKEIGINNFLLLRGDFKNNEKKTGGDFAHASELISFFSKEFPDLDYGAACYPETHLLAESVKKDIKFLKLKQEMGAKYFITQLCFDPTNLENFIKKLRKNSINIPIIAGVMPVLSRNGIINMCLSNGCSIPKNLSRIIGKYEDEEDFKKAGIEFSIELIDKIKDSGVKGIHLYTLNKHKNLKEIIDTISLIK